MGVLQDKRGRNMAPKPCDEKNELRTKQDAIAVIFRFSTSAPRQLTLFCLRVVVRSPIAKKRKTTC